MTPITETAKRFFEACEAGKGWEECKQYCTSDASFSAQAEPLAGVKNLPEYADWMKGMLQIIPDGRYELKAFGKRTGPVTACAHMPSSPVHILARAAPARRPVRA